MAITTTRNPEPLFRPLGCPRASSSLSCATISSPEDDGRGRIVTESQYHAEKMRHHNVRLHGGGWFAGSRCTSTLAECRKR